MAEESHQEKIADYTVQPCPWNQNELIIRKICTFLGPADMSCFRLVCKKWKDESLPFWEHHRIRYILNRFARLAQNHINEALRTAVYNHMSSAMLPPKLLTVFRECRPPRKTCDFKRVGAEDLRNFFLCATKDPSVTQMKKGSFMFLKLRKWNRFGNFSTGEQKGAKWFLNEISDKVMCLTLDRCNLSISQKEFFPALCQLTGLKELTIRGTYFQLRSSFPVEPTLDEISPLPCLKQVEMNYESYTEEKMPNYTFPWNLFLRAFPKEGPGVIFIFSYSNRNNLDFTIQQFSEMMAAAKQLETINLKLITFKNLSKTNSKEAVILEKDVMSMVSGAMKKLQIRNKVIPQAYMRNFQESFKYQFPQTSWKPKFDMIAHLQSSQICLNFLKCGSPEDKEDPADADKYCPPYWNNN